MPVTYVLHGATNRDPKELVCQFFATTEDREWFANDLPGRYERMTLQGVDYDDILVKVEGYGEMI